MFIRALLLIIIATAMASTSQAAPEQADSVSVGLKVVEEFYTGTTKLMTPFEDAPEMAGFKEAAVDRTNDTAAELRTLRWVEAPGQRRYTRVRNIVAAYADSQIEAVKAFTSTLEPSRRSIAADIATELEELKTEKLTRLAATLRYETYEKKRPKPVPIMEPTPHEQKREEGEGIYFR